MLGGFRRDFHEELPARATPRAPRFFTGLDLGCVADFSALVTVECTSIPDPNREGRTVYQFDVRHLHRWHLKTPYPVIVDDVKKLFASGPLHKTTLVIDETGVGRPVTDMFRAAKIEATLRPFSITAGRAQTGNTVAKVHLVAAIQAPLSSGRLRFAKDLPLTPVLTKELETFQVTVDEQTRNESFAAWRNAAHDDLVLALALSLHVANQGEAIIVDLNA